MTQETHPIVELTNEDLDAMLKRALRMTLIIGVIASLAVLIGVPMYSNAAGIIPVVQALLGKGGAEPCC